MQLDTSDGRPEYDASQDDRKKMTKLDLVT